MLIKEIKKHIRTTQQIARICRVMYLISASKLLKDRKRHELVRRYFKQMLHLVSLSDAKGKKKDSSLLKQRPVRKTWYVVVTPDRGFSGDCQARSIAGRQLLQKSSNAAWHRK
jgi:F-type H+-transporting ATPase subunit gamma